jgi:ABC-type multidrug transport system ATPase subunit
MEVSARALRLCRNGFTLEVAACAADASGTVVLGPNGAGKTTLLLALQGLLPAEGTCGRPERCAAVFARPAVLRGTALWNLAAVARTVMRVQRAEAEERALQALDLVGLRGVAKGEARALSTGQRQRLALARALVIEPGALFLDEPFANVDADGRPALRALVREYVSRTGCALLVATSSYADARFLCTQALVLRGGQVVHAGPTAALAQADDPYVHALLAEGPGA